jgi:pyrroline-5-carboxylate reductase
MVVGFIGSGSMAAAMARGWVGAVDQMVFTDSGSGRAAELASEVGGAAVEGNAELAEQADVIVLAVKPAGLGGVATEIGSITKPVISMLGATSLASVEAAFPAADIFRVMPNVAVEVRRGVLCVAGGESVEVRRLLDVLGKVVELPDPEFDAATAVMGCSPAYLALVVEALVDAGTEAGLDEALAQELVVETAAGTAELLGKRPPAEVRSAVASPGGSTEAGLEALDREGARDAFIAAVRASLDRMRS